MNLWTLKRFEECLDRWIETRDPGEDLSYLVTEWILTRQDEPYRGVARDGQVDNLWYCNAIPGTAHGDHEVVVCSYFIYEQSHVVMCASIETLSWPT